MACISTPQYTVVINGGLYGKIIGEKGLRQGDPISPLLFVICMDYLTKILKLVTQQEGFELHKKCLSIKLNHLYFADDVLLFCKGDFHLVMLMLRGLKNFSVASRLTTNAGKSNIFNVNMNLQHLENLCELTRYQKGKLPFSYSWGGAVLSFLYRQMCRASMGTQRDVCGFLPLLQVWVYERFLQLRPPLPQLPANVDIPNLPLACRWVMRRRLEREYDAHHNLPRIRDVLDLLEDAQFIWTPYSEEVIGTLPAYCTFGRHIWRASVPLTCLDIVEHHASERVFRQFGLPQPIPTPPAWHPLHYERDDRSRVDDTFIDWLNAQLAIWDRRGDLNPTPQHFPIEGYMQWYRTVSRLFIGNPVHQAEGRYVS
ncbi:PREDICTED: serine/threonine-protein phosphatase 7 long form homolog [Nicotiana attenuata]|uniref:serine/threonine-protein phosphatase 7 long form homolog n=1 Tax=Nicotiana attenuata TaxID=49451 RepID=UPI0009056597|nr:PREDICTED: serine/threonine-protein phosphatase 7 long form homolog [Nicotiana attenuata]